MPFLRWYIRYVPVQQMEIRWDGRIFSIIVKKLSRIFPEFHRPVSRV